MFCCVTYLTYTTLWPNLSWHHLVLLDPLPPKSDKEEQEEEEEGGGDKDDNDEILNNLIKFSSSSIPLNIAIGKSSSSSSADESIGDQLFDPRVISEDIRARIPIGTTAPINTHPALMYHTLSLSLSLSLCPLDPRSPSGQLESFSFKIHNSPANDVLATTFLYSCT